MISVTNLALYQEALTCLEAHRQSIGQGFMGRFIQIFLGLKFYQNNLPSIYSGSFITSEALESLLDDLYAKVSRSANQCVLSLFQASYLARTGIVAPGNTTAQNTWRNHFHIQKGIGCYAPSSDLSSLTFLNQDRIHCRHLQVQSPGSLTNASCSLCPSGAGYRNESHRKWLRIDPGGNGYAVTDPQQTMNFGPYVAPSGNRIPVIPLIIALYFDADPGLVLGTRTSVDIIEFMADFNLSTQEFTTYFDDSPQHHINARLIGSGSWLTSASHWTQLSAQATQAPLSSRSVPSRSSRTRLTPTTPILSGTPTPQPAINTGWEAEQLVAAALTADGWSAHVVTRQQLGYDIFARKGRRKLYVEVKSSLASCSPSLTAREWQQANYHSNSYVLAILENFNPIMQNTIYWVPDPACCCAATQYTTITHSISRSSWTLSAVPLSHL